MFKYLSSSESERGQSVMYERCKPAQGKRPTRPKMEGLSLARRAGNRYTYTRMNPMMIEEGDAERSCLYNIPIIIPLESEMWNEPGREVR